MRCWKKNVRLIASATIATIWFAAANAQTIVKNEPPQGQLRRGEIVLVDNGKCPRGQVQEVTAGSGGPAANRGVARQRRCVPRP